MNFRFPALILLVVLAGLLQHTNLANLWGIKPNVALAVLVALSVGGTKFYEYVILVLVASVFLKFSPSFEIAPAIFALISLAAYAVNRRLPWTRYLNYGLLIFSATIAFYLLSSPSFLYNNLGIVLTEAVYNLGLGALILLLIK